MPRWRRARGGTPPPASQMVRSTPLEVDREGWEAGAPPEDRRSPEEPGRHGLNASVRDRIRRIIATRSRTRLLGAAVRGSDGVRSPPDEIVIPHPGPLHSMPGIVTATLAAGTRKRRLLACRRPPAGRLAEEVGPNRLLLVWTATAALPASPSNSFPLLDELLLLGLAAIDAMGPKGFPLKRIPSPARSSFLMNAASLLCACVSLVPPGVLWRPGTTFPGGRWQPVFQRP
jgi:hypothetical protein